MRANHASQLTFQQDAIAAAIICKPMCLLRFKMTAHFVCVKDQLRLLRTFIETSAFLQPNMHHLRVLKPRCSRYISKDQLVFKRP